MIRIALDLAEKPAAKDPPSPRSKKLGSYPIKYSGYAKTQVNPGKFAVFAIEAAEG